MCRPAVQPDRTGTAVTEPGGRIRGVVVDDHPVVRSGVRAEIGDAVEIIGEAGDVDTAIEQIQSLRPDVVLLDVHLPDGGGRAVLDGVAVAYPEVRFLALSVSDAAEDVIAVIRGGERGDVTKASHVPARYER